jgi:hypothetical protein
MRTGIFDLITEAKLAACREHNFFLYLQNDPAF